MNDLYYGDNLTVLRKSIADESVDLIYLDPPFNSNANYSHLFKDESGQVSGAQIEAFEDTWHWDDMVSGRALTDLRDSPYQEAANMLDAMVGFLGKNPMTAYLTMMGVRLVELHPEVKFVRIAGNCLIKGNNRVVRDQCREVIEALDRNGKMFIKDIGSDDSPFDDGCYVGAIRPYLAPSPDGDGSYHVYN